MRRLSAGVVVVGMMLLAACADDPTAPPASSDGLGPAAPRYSASATGSFGYSLSKTLPAPGGTPIFVGNLDGDDALDLVLAGPGRNTYVYEESGDGFTRRATLAYVWRAPVVADVDGDGLAEIGAGDYGRYRIFEAMGNDSYAPTASIYTGIPDAASDGDYDGDGQREFLVLREGHPTRMTVIESQPGGGYAVVSTSMTGTSGDGQHIPGTADLDGDGKIETVFNSRPFMWESSTRNVVLSVYEENRPVWQSSSLHMYATQLADTDGNGKLEIVGYTINPAGSSPVLRVLESNGAGGYDLVYSGDMPYPAWYVLDLDLDGRAEFWGTETGESGAWNVVTVAQRTEGGFVRVYDTGDLLPADGGNIARVAMVNAPLWSSGGTGDLWVWQGGMIHILTPGPSDPVPVNEAPVADAGPDQAAECCAHDGTEVTLDGSTSSDADGEIVSYEWFDGAGNLVVEGARPTVTLGLGTHGFTLTVTDDDGATASDDVVIDVVDTTAPVIDLAQTVSEIWPANHQMIAVATVAAADVCDGAPALSLEVTSNEAINGPGDGDTESDWTVTDNGNGSFTVHVRAERSGTADGRVYTVGITATDASGNVSSASATVTVPHDRGNGKSKGR